MPKVLVIGDLMIDHYIWGSCERISPEAPVQVVLKQSETKRLGGCGNVVSNLIALGADVGVISVLGDDSAGREIIAMLASCKAKAELVLQERGRKSSQKSRIMVSHQQVLRVDNESADEISLDDEIIARLEGILKRYDIVLLSDYGKGVLTNKLTNACIKTSKALNKAVLVDPKGKDYSKYKGATLLTPNRKEASGALGYALASDADISKGLRELKERFELDFGLVTLSEQGIALWDGQNELRDPALAKEVYDVTGAGDSVLATLGYCLARGDNIKTALKYANLAAAVVVGKVGSADANWDEIHALAGFHEGKIKSKEQILTAIKELRKKGKKIVFTNGCFDVLHSGHTSYLKKARALGDVLIVGLNSDESVRRLKGKSRPINDENERASMLEALEAVDFVVIFEGDTPELLIKDIAPDVLAKGADYANKEVVGAKYATKLALIDFKEGKSTSALVEKIKKNC